MELRPCSITMIDLHHTAGHEASIEDIRNEHMNGKGWGDIGYNAVVFPDGSIPTLVNSDGVVSTGRSIKWSGAHNPGLAPDGSKYTMNERSYGISHVGNFQSPNADTMSDVQFQSSVQFCVQKCKEFGIVPSTSTIRRHKDDYATDCPGDNFPYERYMNEVIKLFNNGDEDLHMKKAVLLNTPEPKDLVLVAEYFAYTSPCPVLFRVNGQPPEEAFKVDELIIIGGVDVPNHPNRKYYSGSSWFGTVTKVGQSLGQ